MPSVSAIGAGMLAAGRAEAVERVLGDVVAALHRDLLDGVGHVLDRDADEAIGHLLRRAAVADLASQLGEGFAHRLLVERLIPARPEDRREGGSAQLAHHDVGVGDGERPAAAIALGAGIGAGRLRADAKAGAVVEQDGAAARRHRVDAQHRHAHAHARHLGLERALVLAGEMRHVGRGAAHVEADHLLEAGEPRRLRHADHAAGRAGEDRVAALEQLGRFQPAGGGHEQDVGCTRAALRPDSPPPCGEGLGVGGPRRPAFCDPPLPSLPQGRGRVKRGRKTARAPPSPRAGAGSARDRHPPPWYRHARRS